MSKKSTLKNIDFSDIKVDFSDIKVDFSNIKVEFSNFKVDFSDIKVGKTKKNHKVKWHWSGSFRRNRINYLRPNKIAHFFLSTS